MKSFLLDTHTLLWFLTDVADLSAHVKKLIENSDHTILISPASYWEIAIKISLGKYQLPQSLDIFLKEQLEINQFQILPITLQHVARIIDLPFHHRDPFDRLIAAQALVEDIPLLSIDKIMDAYAVKRIW